MDKPRAGLTEAEIAEASREPMTIHLLSAVDIVATIAALRAELAAAHQRIEALASDNAIRDEALKAAHLARETATRELAARTEALAAARKALLAYRLQQFARVCSPSDRDRHYESIRQILRIDARTGEDDTDAAVFVAVRAALGAP